LIGLANAISSDEPFIIMMARTLRAGHQAAAANGLARELARAQARS